MRSVVPGIGLGLALLLLCDAARANDRPALSTLSYPLRLTVHASLLSDAPDSSNVAGGFGGALEVGVRNRFMEVFFLVERDRWLGVEQEMELNAGVLNAGVGAAWYLFDGRVSASMAVGSSTLLFETTFDSPGETGVFLDIRPATLRWPIRPRWTLLFTPITFTLLMPVLHDPPLRQLEYRSVFGVEVTL